MCGIFGYAKTQNGQSDNQLEKLKDIFTYLADESVVRGTDSTGISMINPTDRRTFKATASSSEVVNDKTWKSEILDRVDRDSTIAIGHVRLATHGVINTRNAHPFEIGDVIGAHNGIIYNYNKLADKYNKNIEVDSEIIFESLNLKPMDKALEELEGDEKLSWIKDSNKIVHLARESSRPISVAYWKKARILLWASTGDILNKALDRADLSLNNVSLKSDTIYSFNTDKFKDKYNPSKIKFESKTKKYNNSFNTTVHGDYSWTSYYDEIDYNESIDKKDTQCEMCIQKFRMSDLIEVETDIYVCIDCYDDIEPCEWCGDYMFFDESTTFNKWSICVSCKPSAEKRLLLDETCSMKENREEIK
jgi:asparagine synthetase B (glutamine-hydrolysing)